MLPEGHRPITCSIQPAGDDEVLTHDQMEVDSLTPIVNDVSSTNAAGRRSNVVDEEDFFEVFPNQALRIDKFFVHQSRVRGEPAQLGNQTA